MHRAEARKLELARNQLKYTVLRASRSGVVTSVRFEVGQVVPEGLPVVSIANPGEPEIVVDVPEDQVAAFQTARFKASLASAPADAFDVALRELSPQADVATRTYAARFTIENPDDSVALGMTATVTLSHSADASVAKLPLAAILNRGTGPSVYVVDKSGELELRPVKVASFTEDTALVTSGVANGDRIVKLGVQKLDAGQRVRAIDER